MKPFKVGNITITPFQSNVRFDKLSTLSIDSENLILSKVITKQKLKRIIESLDRIIPETVDFDSKNELIKYREITKKELDTVNSIALSVTKGIYNSEKINEQIIELKHMLGKNELDEFQINFEKFIDPKSKQFNDYILNKSSLQRVEESDRQGIISIEQKELIINRKILGMLVILDSLKEEDIIK